MTVSRIDLAYAAGFFDGDGHIRIQNHSKRCRTMMLQCTVVQATEEIVQWFAETFGGTVSSRLLKYRGGVRPLHTWQISSKGAERFLVEIYPYMKGKRDEADVALAFRATFRPQHVKGGHKRMSKDVIELRQSQSNLLRAIRKEKREQSRQALVSNVG